MDEGDLVWLDIDTHIVGTDELFDTTSYEVAKAAGALPDHDHDGADHKVEDHYGPRAILVGKGRLPPGLEDAILAAAVGNAATIEVPPEQGYGDRDPKLVEVLSRNELLRLPEFRKEGIEPFVGMTVTVRNRSGVITGATAGRVRVDFNNRLAGKTLRYTFTVREKVTAPAEQVRALVELHYGHSTKFTITYIEEESAATIVLAERCKTDLRWHTVKLALVRDLRSVVDLRRIDLVESYIKTDAPEAVDDSEADASDAGGEEE